MDVQAELHPDDVVALSTQESQLGVVEKTHGDVDTHEPHPGRHEPDRIHHDRSIKQKVFDKFMKDGIPPKDTVLVRWQHTTNTQLIQSSKLKLVDRSLIMGDVVKRKPQDAMSGVVINTFTRCTLQPVCDLSLVQNSREVLRLKGLLPPSDNLDYNIQQDKPSPLIDIPASELRYVESITEDGLVIYKDWIGRVDSLVTAISLKLSDSCVVEIEDDQAEHVDGAIDNFYVGDIASTKKGTLRNGKWIYGKYNPNTMPVGTVVQTRNVEAEISWLQRRIGSSGNAEEPPSPLERDELESSSFRVYDKTARPKAAALSNAISNSEIDVRLGLRVRFKDLSGACVKYNGASRYGHLKSTPRTSTLGYDLNVFDVVKFQTDLTVQWQDLSISTERSIDLVPDMNIDDVHAAWPGEIAHTLNFSSSPTMPGISWPERVGVIQDVNAAERMAKILWCPGASLHYAEDTENTSGEKMLLTGVVGFPGTQQEEISLYDIEAPAAMNVRRGDGALVSNQRWKEDREVEEADSGVDWFGEVVDTGLDGSLTVRLGAANEIRDVVLRREDLVIAVRSDGTDEVDGWNDHAIEDDEDWSERADTETSTYSDYDDDEITGSDMEIEVTYQDADGNPLDPDDVKDEVWESSDEEEQDEPDFDVDMLEVPPESPTPPTSNPDEIQLVLSEDTSAPNPTTLPKPSSEPTPTEPYLILDTSPSCHAFAFQPEAQNATQLKRIAKEHKILRSPDSLPQSVYVRTWESRLDLLRVLFIGPSDTPYANAPFIIDFYLSEDFPFTAPRAHFHSWTSESGLGGVGRVNPNLYEDGKICLSLLGTWEGNKAEGWVPNRSTILQVIVSILGLVLVREPYFNEAGYETLVGMESAKRPSALYSERAFLRTRTFVLKALALAKSDESAEGSAIEGLQDVIRTVYQGSGSEGLAARVIKDVEDVIKRSDSGTAESDGLTVVSKGACIPLRRIREQLLTL